MRQAICSDALVGLQAIVAAPDDADPESLCEIAAARADTLRMRLTLARSLPGLPVGATEAEFEEPRCYLHDTTLQVLEYLACAGFGFCGDVQTMHEVAGRAADDLSHWIDVNPSPPKAADLGLALATIAASAQGLGAPKVRMTIAETLPDLSDDIVEAVTGAVRESLTNVRKHADASEVHIIAASTRQGVAVVVADDGCGIAPGTPEGLGVPNSIVGRLRRVGAEGRVVSDGDGTQVRIAIRVAS